ncbi:MAG: Asp-tRNA(Asn)/Glu-tRNA(Gln) amidotransferase GatCAB subunit B, partial [Pseudomonadota bacterium]|nr:Asp-tRNA(Asn)/Glu-tRNA(Gln) amidotransferase GatCAB subunit B [Pseudomonadota bacterium]
TRSMRSKEEAHDYRYFPDPDLLPLIFSEDVVEKIKNSIPELPDERKKRFESDYSLSSYDSSILVGDKETADYFEELTVGRNAKLVANWLTGEFFAAMNKLGFSVENSPISKTNFGMLIDLIENNTISNRIAKDIFEIMIETGDDPETIVEKKGMKQVSDEGELEEIIDSIIEKNPEQVESLNEKPKLMGWFVGQVMKETNGKANPSIVNKLLSKKLNN